MMALLDPPVKMPQYTSCWLRRGLGLLEEEIGARQQAGGEWSKKYSGLMWFCGLFQLATNWIDRITGMKGLTLFPLSLREKHPKLTIL